jgi:hypothetical protein
MLRHGPKILIATVAAVGVLGAGVAVAADPPTCPFGNTPQAGQVAQPSTPNATGTQHRLLKRDGTGPRHAQQVKERQSRSPGSQGRATGNRGVNCPYRN